MSRLVTDILRAEDNTSFRRQMKRFKKRAKKRMYDSGALLTMVFVAFCAAALSDAVEESEEDESLPRLH